MRKKNIFLLLLAVLAGILALMPLTLSVNNLLTRLLEKTAFYIWIDKNIVPFEIRLVGGVVRLLGINFIAKPEGFTANGVYARLTWNCLGWQSLIFFLLSLPVGYTAGRYTKSSIFESFLIGALGTFIVNLVRILLTVILLVFTPTIFAVVFHDYLSALTTIAWMFFFWWFSYKFVLDTL